MSNIGQNIIFLNPVFKNYIWGGTKLKTRFGYDIPDETAAECWSIAAHENGSSVVSEGEFAGCSLSELFNEHGELFGDARDKFPLLVKLIDAKDNLSIQVHPDDNYARVHENDPLGKTECWYIIDCDEGAEIVLGHNARTKEELENMISGGKWDDLIKKVSIKKGDFIQIKPGTVHAICGGVMLLETQQNSDVTYRLYDYGRLNNGKLRELHIDKALNVVNVPDEAGSDIKNYLNVNDNEPVKLVSCEYYTVWKLNVNGSYTLSQDRDFMNVSVIEGNGYVNGHPVKKGSSFILPNKLEKAEFSGNMEIIISAP